jgi:hypothetical protein
MSTADQRVLPLWHYTPLERLQPIVLSGVLRPTAVAIDPGERPAVWFSANQYFEQTAAKMVREATTGTIRTLSMEEMHDLYGVVRIGVHPSNPRLIGWDGFRRTSGISKTTARALCHLGHPHVWFASYTPVPTAEWIAVDVWTGTCWAPASAEQRYGQPVTPVGVA